MRSQWLTKRRDALIKKPLARHPQLTDVPARAQPRYLQIFDLRHAPMSTPPVMPPSLSAPPPASCRGTCVVASGGFIHCDALLSLACDEAVAVRQSLACRRSILSTGPDPDACAGCCTYSMPSAPPPDTPPSPPSQPPLPSPAFPSFGPGSCPWVNASSDEPYALVCLDGSRCDVNQEGYSCCNCPPSCLERSRPASPSCLERARPASARACFLGWAHWCLPVRACAWVRASLA